MNGGLGRDVLGEVCWGRSRGERRCAVSTGKDVKKFTRGHRERLRARYGQDGEGAG